MTPGTHRSKILVLPICPSSYRGGRLLLGELVSEVVRLSRGRGEDRAPIH